MTSLKSLNLTLEEVKAVVGSETSSVKSAEGNLVLVIHPMYSSDISKGIKIELDALSSRYNKVLRGIPMAYEKVKVSPNGASKHTNPYLHFRVQATFYVFSPEVGNKLEGIVKKKSLHHLSCLVHKMFNVSIPRPHDSEGWEGASLNEGDVVELTVTSVDMSFFLPLVNGVLNRVISSCQTNAEEQKDAEEGIESEVVTSNRIRFDSGFSSSEIENEEEEKCKDEEEEILKAEKVEKNIKKEKVKKVKKEDGKSSKAELKMKNKEKLSVDETDYELPDLCPVEPSSSDNESFCQQNNDTSFSGNDYKTPKKMKSSKSPKTKIKKEMINSPAAATISPSLKSFKSPKIKKEIMDSPAAATISPSVKAFKSPKIKKEIMNSPAAAIISPSLKSSKSPKIKIKKEIINSPAAAIISSPSVKSFKSPKIKKEMMNSPAAAIISPSVKSFKSPKIKKELINSPAAAVFSPSIKSSKSPKIKKELINSPAAAIFSPTVKSSKSPKIKLKNEIINSPAAAITSPSVKSSKSPKIKVKQEVINSPAAAIISPSTKSSKKRKSDELAENQKKRKKT